MKWLLVVCLALGGCVNASMTCPDKVSTVTYRGIALTGNTAISCVGNPLMGGDTIQVSGIDIMALAAAVAPLVMTRPAPSAGSSDPGTGAAPDENKHL